jgi:hypothetical protein
MIRAILNTMTRLVCSEIDTRYQDGGSYVQKQILYTQYHDQVSMLKNGCIPNITTGLVCSKVDIIPIFRTSRYNKKQFTNEFTYNPMKPLGLRGSFVIMIVTRVLDLRC